MKLSPEITLMLTIIVALMMMSTFAVGYRLGKSEKHEQWCRATNTELSKFDECVKNEDGAK